MIQSTANMRLDNMLRKKLKREFVKEGEPVE